MESTAIGPLYSSIGAPGSPNGYTGRIGARADSQGHWSVITRGHPGRVEEATSLQSFGGQRLVRVSDLLDSIGARDLPDHQIDRLVRDLNNDGLISELGFGSVKTSEIRLTSEGRYEVEQWLAEPDRATDKLPVPKNQVFNINNTNITGSTIVSGSTVKGDVTTNYGASGDELVKLVAQFRELLKVAELSPDDRESLEADLEVIEEEAAAPQPRPGRLRPILRRLKQALIGGAVAGLEAGTKQETIDLIDMAQKALTG